MNLKMKRFFILIIKNYLINLIKKDEPAAAQQPGTPVRDEKTGLLTNDQVDDLAMQLEDKWEELAAELRHIKSEGN